MYWGDVLELGAEVEILTENGEPKTSVNYAAVYANKKSVRQSEFYQAANAGLKPELVFEIRTFDFEGQTRARFNGKEYFILRIYENGDLTELTLSAHVGRGV